MDRKEIKITLPKGEGQPIGQFLRQLGLTKLSSWRPIAYSLNISDTNALHSSGNIVQSMLDFSSNLSLLEYSSDVKGTILSEQYTFNGSLTSDDLKGKKISCVTKGVKLLDNLSKETVTLQVYYRYGYGKYNTSQNLAFIQDACLFKQDLKILSSLHSPLATFTFKVNELDLDEEELIMTITGKQDNAIECLKETINVGIEQLSSISKII